MYLITSVLRDGAGDEIAQTHSTSIDANLAFASADAWTRGQLSRQDDPDAYVEHSIEVV